MKYRMGALLGMAVLLMVASIGHAAIVERTYMFTGADLINNVFDPTARYSQDGGSLRVHEGMRQIGPANSGATGATFLTGSYLTNFNNRWNTAVTDGRVLSRVSLSGNDGVVGQWGEDYKPYAWVSGTGPAGWDFGLETLTKPKGGNYTVQYPVWTTAEAGLGLTSTELASQVFTVTIQFDTDDMWWENPDNYVYGCNTAPNSLDGLTMYFNSYFSDDVGYTDKYVGNMFAAAVPEPTTLLIWTVLGTLGAFVYGRRK